MSTSMLNNVASSVASSVVDTAKKHAQEQALKTVKNLDLEKKGTKLVGTVASNYTRGVINEHDIANLAKNPNREGLMSAVQSNKTVSGALNSQLFKKATDARDLAEKTLKDKVVITGGKRKSRKNKRKKTRKNKRKTRKNKRKTRKNKTRI